MQDNRIGVSVTVGRIVYLTVGSKRCNDRGQQNFSAGVDRHRRHITQHHHILAGVHAGQRMPGIELGACLNDLVGFTRSGSSGKKIFHCRMPFERVVMRKNALHPELQKTAGFAIHKTAPWVPAQHALGAALSGRLLARSAPGDPVVVRSAGSTETSDRVRYGSKRCSIDIMAPPERRRCNRLAR